MCVCVDVVTLRDLQLHHQLRLWFTFILSPYTCMQAKTRVKLNFLDNLAKFWELQVSVCTCKYVSVYLCYESVRDLH